MGLWDKFRSAANLDGVTFEQRGDGSWNLNGLNAAIVATGSVMENYRLDQERKERNKRTLIVVLGAVGVLVFVYLYFKNRR